VITGTLAERLLSSGGLTPLFQPILRTRTRPAAVHSYECLSRGPAGTNLAQADVLFEYVRLKRMETEIDRACVTAALRSGSTISGAPALSLNVHATTLTTDRAFVDHLGSTAAETGIAASRLTVEIVEHSPALDNRKFLDAIERLRRLGVSIALDDVGLGQSNYKMIFDAQPDYLKIDKFFVSHCDAEPRRRAIIESIADLARRFGAEAVAEGVERPEELDTLAALGIDLIQGYLFSQPLPIEFFLGRDADGENHPSEEPLALAWR
jgi:EAL domain-containing protein (putative c-di-GMP-specific phosphodiesterase class I)